jgi:hypothetical protein
VAAELPGEQLHVTPEFVVSPVIAAASGIIAPVVIVAGGAVLIVTVMLPEDELDPPLPLWAQATSNAHTLELIRTRIN